MDLVAELRRIKSPQERWTLKTFLASAKLIHSDLFDYSKILEDDIKNNLSKVNISCKICGNNTTPAISNHLRGLKCGVCCLKQKRMTLKKFLAAACKIHNGKYDYSGVREEDVRGNRSFINITCNICKYNWNVKIHTHITLKSNCPSCTDRVPWTLERFIRKSTLVHGEGRWDYSLVDVLKSDGRVFLKCKTCKNTSTPLVTSHIQGRGCGYCFNQRRNWTLEKFLDAAYEIHGNKYDYSKMKDKDANHNKCRLKVRCKKCNSMFSPLLSSHITKRTGCPVCTSSKGETLCVDILLSLKIKFKREYRLGDDRKFYDFYFVYGSKKYVLEYDGVQHFKYNKFYHRSFDVFYEKQEIDISKTKKALNSGFSVIRIDYTQLENIEYHIKEAIKMEKDLYVSNEEMYDYILSPIIEDSYYFLFQGNKK